MHGAAGNCAERAQMHARFRFGTVLLFMGRGTTPKRGRGQSAEVNKRVHFDGDGGARSEKASRKRQGRVQHLGAKDPPWWAEWAYETELYTGPDGTPDPSEKTKLARWRKNGRIFGRLNEQDGGVMIAVRPGSKVAIFSDDPYAVGTAALDSPDEHERHLALELKLRGGPVLGDGSWDKPLVRFTLTMAEWEELELLREAHGWGAELGSGPMQTYWRAAGELADKLVVTGVHKYVSHVLMNGRALK